MSEPAFRTATVQLFRECFEGRPEGATGTWFVEGKEGIFDALDSLTAEQASNSAKDGVSTIAAHTFHIEYTLKWANTWNGGEKPVGSWEDSWKKQTVTAEDWDSLRASVHSLYQAVVEYLESNEDWSREDNEIGILANLPHMAYHLGAMRVLLKFVQESA